jgi:hypothetical protein
MVFGYDLLCDLLEMLNAVATRSRSNSANEYGGLMTARFRAFDLRTEGYRGLCSIPDGSFSVS